MTENSIKLITLKVNSLMYLRNSQNEYFKMFVGFFKYWVKKSVDHASISCSVNFTAFHEFFHCKLFYVSFLNDRTDILSLFSQKNAGY